MRTLEQRAGDARKLYEALEEINRVRNHFYWQQAELLYKLRSGNLYKLVFGEQGNQSWSSFLTEIGVPPSTASQKLTNYQFFIVKHGFTVDQLTGADTSSLYHLAQYRPDSDEAGVRELVTQLQEKSVTRGDFIAMMKGNDCAHPKEPVRQTVFTCPDCHRKVGSAAHAH